MKLRIAIAVAALAGLCAAPSPVPVPVPGIADLAGRTPGKPQRCIPGQSGLLFQTSQADPHLLLYDDGKTLWVSKLAPSCGFGPGQSAIPDGFASSYCRGDFVLAGGRETLLPFGRRCVLGDFTPYRKAK